MAIQKPVKFHLTEAGPKKCIAQISCPYSSEAPHYDNYWDAAKAWEVNLSEVYSTFSPLENKKFDDYESLLEPQNEDIELASGFAMAHYYRITTSKDPNFTKAYEEFGFEYHVTSFAQLSEEDKQEFDKQMILILAAREKSWVDDSYAKASLSEMVDKYRGPETLRAYREYFNTNLLNQPEIQVGVNAIAKDYSLKRSFERALANGYSIPEAPAKIFEEIWSGDENTFGSQLYFENEIRETYSNWRRMRDSPNPDAIANELGYKSEKSGVMIMKNKINALRRYYRARGRNFTPTINKVLRRQKREAKV